MAKLKHSRNYVTFDQDTQGEKIEIFVSYNRKKCESGSTRIRGDDAARKLCGATKVGRSFCGLDRLVVLSFEGRNLEAA